MQKPAKPTIPGLIPEPAEIELLGGDSQLSLDVRLVTSNVLPMQRKAMRGILNTAGVRVVANKKKFVIDVEVVAPEDMDFNALSARARDEYYELTLDDCRVLIRTASQAGALWGTQTLGQLYRLSTQGAVLPNMRIRDWPAVPYRGVFAESIWGADRMEFEDWAAFIDHAAALKLNCIGVGLYGCWPDCRADGAPAEFLMVPLADRPELRTRRPLRWYSPKTGEWRDSDDAPVMADDDLFGRVVTQGKEKGLVVIPFVNSLGHNSFLPRETPEVSAKADDGTPLGVGYCLSNPATRTFIEGFYGSILERYYPEGAEFFHVQLDEALPTFADPQDPSRKIDPWCRCAPCAARSREENMQEYIVWLVSMLTGKGVERVLMWGDQLARQNLLGKPFAAALAQAGVADRLVLHSRCDDNERACESAHPALATALGFPSWVAPTTGCCHWSHYQTSRRNIALMAALAHGEGAEGVMAYGAYAPAWADHDALLAALAWNPNAGRTVEELLEQWATSLFGASAQQVLTGLAALERASEGELPLSRCARHWRTYCREGTPFPRPYPQEVLDELLHPDAKPAAGAALDGAAAAAVEALACFGVVAACEGLPSDSLTVATSLRGEAARAHALACVFASLCRVRQGAANGVAADELAADVEVTRTALLDDLGVVESDLPSWMAPAALAGLGALLAFLEQLGAELREAAAGTRDIGRIRWSVDAS